MDKLTVVDIFKQYTELLELFGDSKTVADARRLEDTGMFYNVEVEGYPCHDVYNDDLDYVPDWIRLENYKNLCYIYFFDDGQIRFDIEVDDDLMLETELTIADITKTNLEKWYSRL